MIPQRPPNVGLLSRIFNLDPGKKLTVGRELIDGVARTFPEAVEEMGTWPSKVIIYAVIRRDLPSNHFLRMYKIAQD
jgi:hypothetical protein